MTGETERAARSEATACSGCRNGDSFPIDFSMAFQPIVDVQQKRIFAYEALVRGQGGSSASSVLASVDETNRYAFDQKCRVKAIELAAALGVADVGASLSINFLPNAIYRPEVCIRTTLDTAARVGFPTDRIVFEFTENQKINEPDKIREIVKAYRSMGFKTAIDDFGAGFAGLNLLAEFQPDIVKLDMELIRDIGADRVRRSIVAGILLVTRDIGIDVIAEGVESREELTALGDLGITKFQGYYFAEPAYEALPVPKFP